MESELLAEAAKQVPTLAALIYLVIWFLKHIGAVSKRVEDRMSEINEHLADIIEKNTEAISRTNLLMEQLDRRIERSDL
tara:strand:- start:830 stop:1066 length:237 start_codon:yes stop_codon:yes gene_type:complete